MEISICWFKRNLRTLDNPALYYASKADVLIPIWIWDKNLLNKSNIRDNFIYQAVNNLDKDLQKKNSYLFQFNNDYLSVFENIITFLNNYNQNINVTIYTAKENTIYHQNQVRNLTKLINKYKNVKLRALECQSNLDLEQIKTIDNNYYKLFTPFYKKYLDQDFRKFYPEISKKISQPKLLDIFYKQFYQKYHLKDLDIDIKNLNYEASQKTALKFLNDFLTNKIKNYEYARNQLANNTSKLSLYLNFGLISSLTIFNELKEHNEIKESFLRQLVWREFYLYILLFHKTKLPLNKKYKNLKSYYNQKYINAVVNAQTGFPLIDASIKELYETGYMHNRARMIFASFITKTLHLPYTWGEDFFYQYLIDGDIANNRGNWQWMSSVGADPAPVFKRIFNPVRQHEIYDKNSVYVKKYLPELQYIDSKKIYTPWLLNPNEQLKYKIKLGVNYPYPIVKLKTEREKALELYNTVNID